MASLVTGGYSGLGRETTRALADAGASVIVPALRPDHAREVLSDVGTLSDSGFDQLAPGDIAVATDPDSPFARFMGVDTHAIDPDEPVRLWALSAERTGVDAFS